MTENFKKLDLRKYSNAKVVFPESAQCPTCGFFDISIPMVQQLMEEAGRHLWDAKCRCPSDDEEKRARAEERRKWANLPHNESPRIFDNFMQREGTAEAVEKIWKFSQGLGSQIVVLVGATGTGKSHLLEATGRELLERGIGVRYILCGDFVDEFRSTYSDNSEMEYHSLLEYYRECPVVLLDDIGMERRTDYANEVITRLVENRLQYGGRLLVATNLDYESMVDKYGHRLASRIWSSKTTSEFENVIITATDFRLEVKS